ncbi:MAG: hypothetical protein ACXVBE_11625, partial [Bdellovibrionota bacterium]
LLAGFVPWISDVNSALVLSEIQKKQTSVTTSFFAGPEFKNAANEIGLNNVNMEDSHVIDVLNANKIPAEISRVIADPAFLDQEAAAALRDWYASATYSAKQYEEAILWGLSGLDLTRPPDTAKWDVFAKFSPEKARKWIDYHKFQNESAPLDPFYYEIAQNFLDSVQSGTAQRVYLAEVDGKLSANARNILEKEIEKTARKAQEIETQYKKFASGKLPEAELRKSIKGLIESLTYLSVKEEPLRSELLKNSSAKEVDGKAVLNLLAAAKDGDSLKVWKSTSSDYSNITQANDILSGPNPSNESIDRATYIHARTLRLPLAASENTVRELVWLKSK